MRPYVKSWKMLLGRISNDDFNDFDGRKKGTLGLVTDFAVSLK